MDDRVTYRTPRGHVVRLVVIGVVGDRHRDNLYRVREQGGTTQYYGDEGGYRSDGLFRGDELHDDAPARQMQTGHTRRRRRRSGQQPRLRCVLS